MTSNVLDKEELKDIYTSYLDRNMSRKDISIKFGIPESIVSEILKAGSYAGMHSRKVRR